MTGEALAAHRGLVSAFAELYELIGGARFERRPGLIFLLCPQLPVPQFNGAWIEEDSPEACRGLADAVAEVDAAAEAPWVQTRTGHERTRDAARALGLTFEEVVPGMAMRPGDLVGRDEPPELEIAEVTADGAMDAVGLLAEAFGVPPRLFAPLCAALERLPGARWYAGRAGGELAATALGIVTGETLGVFNVATAAGRRRHGYGAALTSRAVRDGFEAGAELAYLQSSEAGHSVYRQLGFRDVQEYVLLARPPG